MKEEAIERTKEEVNEGTKEEATERMKEQVNEGTKEGTTEKTKEQVNEGTKEGATERMKEEATERTNEQATERTKEDATERMTEVIPKRMTEEATESRTKEVSDWVIREVPERMIEELPKRMTEDATESTPEEKIEEKTEKTINPKTGEMTTETTSERNVPPTMEAQNEAATKGVLPMEMILSEDDKTQPNESFVGIRNTMSFTISVTPSLFVFGKGVQKVEDFYSVVRAEAKHTVVHEFMNATVGRIVLLLTDYFHVQIIEQDKMKASLYGSTIRNHQIAFLVKAVGTKVTVAVKSNDPTMALNLKNELELMKF
eukprot:TRINITY_DN5286_c0_g1_i1.p1 TRINITY_DN5286_c0_g1~~TRINITY_DN5286_c0_g1_i1.p1  ORF type:complete len:315 (-),score=86.07 TRINITY_DN5286_c0_g1_i1:280-1224(-)